MITKEDRMATGVVDYFRNALAAIGRHSRLGNEKHNPGERMHWAFDKSTAHADAILSHLSQRGEIDPETGHSHTVALAWRALALLETELVAGGATPGKAVLRTQQPPPAAPAPGEIRVSEDVVPSSLRDRFSGLAGGKDSEPERWGIFDSGGYLVHGQITKLCSREEAEGCVQARHHAGSRVAQIALIDGEWREAAR